MANIKVSEMTEATNFNNNDYTMIVQSNANKRISKSNMLDGYVKATDISGLKTYSTTEVNTGMTWIDGKPIYRKVYYVPSLPNAGSLYIDTNITDLEYIFYIYGMASTGAPLNAARPDGSHLEIAVWYDTVPNQLRIATGIDRTSVSAYIIMEYTKTTD